MIRKAFAGIQFPNYRHEGIRFFNSARPSSGLAAGQSIEEGLLEELHKSQIVIWMATPSSIEKSFFMAWELGVALALKKSVLPCVALGLTSDKLPLWQSGKLAPDISDVDALIELIKDIGKALGLEPADAEKNVEEVIKNASKYEYLKLFRSRAVLDVLSIRSTGERLILENRSDHDLSVINYGEKLNEAYTGLRSITNLKPKQRRIIEVSTNVLRQQNDMQIIRVEWMDIKHGRCHQELKVEKID